MNVSFAYGERRLQAVRNVSVEVRVGETVALVGESGSGKSTLALALMMAEKPDSGQIWLNEVEVKGGDKKDLQNFRQNVQMVLQDPYSSLDPRWSVERIIREPLTVHSRMSSAQMSIRVRELLKAVGLPEGCEARLPSQFSGGQRQRVAIARALAMSPSVLIADEPVSALDVSIQAQIVNLLDEIQKEQNLSYLVIGHDLPLMHHISDYIYVMYLGSVVESGPSDAVVTEPLHPYTASLLSATPRAESQTRERIVLRGDPPSAINIPSGCPFHPRCPVARPRCAVDIPKLARTLDGREVACFYPGEIGGIPLQ